MEQFAVPGMLAMSSASQSLAALSSDSSSTVCRSNAERLMTFSTSAVAVCPLQLCFRACFLEQANVLNRDHRLVGKGAKQLDVMVGKRPGFLAGDADHADHRPPLISGVNSMLRKPRARAISRKFAE